MNARAPFMVLLLLAVTLAGCLADDDTPRLAAADPSVPFLDHLAEAQDLKLELVEEAFLLAGEGVQLHARIVKPAGEGPFPVIAQFTPYTAPGKNAELRTLIEPPADLEPHLQGQFSEDYFAWQFVRRGYAFAFGDVRGTGDSSGCLDLRGALDIADLDRFTEWLGTQTWSNGNVGFIGGSYPGSTSHMAAIAGNPHLKAVVPVVASTSFYHYHHNDGVPYSGQHSLGGTNTGYTTNAIQPTVNPQHPNYAPRYVEEGTRCPYKENMLDHGGLDQTGAYYDWWQERDLRPLVPKIKVPVLMAQGLADWNVKPDHIATWYNDLEAPKTLIAGQWGHAWPASKSDECDSYDLAKRCDPAVPYGDWWNYVSVFFDTHLKGIDTGMFETDVAWVQADDGTWHRSVDWPLQGDERDDLVLHLTHDGRLSETPTMEAAERPWNACPRDRDTYGQRDLRDVSDAVREECSGTLRLVFESEPFTETTYLSGVPLLDLTLRSSASFTHLVWRMDLVHANGTTIAVEVDTADDGSPVFHYPGQRENYGYLNPTYREGLDQPKDVPVDQPYTVTIDGYPQEDVIEAGWKVRLSVQSHDDRRTIEAFEEGVNTLILDPANVNTLTLPVRSPDLQGVRLPEPVEEAA